VTKIISIWGKGGVGKSTCASSLAYLLSKKGFRVLLLTTDFVPTISRIFDVRDKGLINVPGSENLFIYELSPDDVSDLWKQRFGDEVYEVISSFLPVNKDIIDYIARAPGIPDEFMLYVLYELYVENKFDYIIWDLPAAGDALKLLWIEREFYSHLGDAAKMYLKLKGFLQRLKSKESKSPLKLINEWRELADGIFTMLKSKNHRALIITTLDDLSVEVTKHIINELEGFQINIDGLIINMVWPDSSELAKLFNNRLKMQEANLNKIKEIASRLNKDYIIIPLLNFQTINNNILEMIGREIVTFVY